MYTAGIVANGLPSSLLALLRTLTGVIVSCHQYENVIPLIKTIGLGDLHPMSPTSSSFSPGIILPIFHQASTMALLVPQISQIIS